MNFFRVMIHKFLYTMLLSFLGISPVHAATKAVTWEATYYDAIPNKTGIRANKRLTRAMLFFMYWNCDIGSTADAETD
ncbi:MAG: hypothetical protein K2Q14_06170 [Gammaproteobacteria bacterium]|nr:hypothetical protein [Gammaproteobacteria bacterium]